MKQYVVLSIFTILSIFTAGAQQIKGNVIDGLTSEPLPFANIVIVNKDSSAAFVGTVTDMKKVCQNEAFDSPSFFLITKGLH